ncbi:tetratricopeptide repeat protein [Shimia ponticola]|uniref:tetratricopeptide repeat protein n=1 Tax=Shimia ponticola TaxID=2582893 RepID=UPI002101E55F|nr:tetratricopeptide repeat protein [Shimia ponticola]
MTTKTILGLVIAMGMSVSASADTIFFGTSGSYLAARQAAADRDFKSAARFYTEALNRHPGNHAHMENAMAAYLALGDMPAASDLAQRMLQSGSNSQIAHMVSVTNDLMAGSFTTVTDSLSEATRIGPLVDSLVHAWSLIGDGYTDDGLSAFDAIADDNGLREFALYHKALALGMVGEYGGAEAILSGEAEGPITHTRRGIIARAQMLSQLDRNADAITLITEVFGTSPDATLSSLLRRLRAGEPIPFTQVKSASDGAAEVFYTIGAALNGEARDSYSLLYTRLAEALDPAHIDAILLSAEYLEKLGRHDLATAAYDRVPRNAPEFVSAELGRASALSSDDRPDAAVEVLSQLAEAFPDDPNIHIRLGDTLRRMESYRDAADAYDAGIALYTESSPRQWFTYFARGITHERSGNWDAAEADFRHALTLQPEQPQVLNYLGYSLVEKNLKLDEALAMIETAAIARPDSGHIMDSLGWVLYRLGRADEAVAPMEAAVELMATDPIINDHLGDVYWSVGRYTEARFQWNRAMSFGPEEEDANRIRRKLDIGLDAVLAEEKEAAIAVAQDG